MTTPIPLTDPDGTVWAWACGTCGDARACYPDGERVARVCCARCLACRGYLNWRTYPLCVECTARGRRAFEVLAAIGMAVAVRHYGDGRAAAEGERQALPCWPGALAVTGATVGLAALCGVDAETARRWRS